MNTHTEALEAVSGARLSRRAALGALLAGSLGCTLVRYLPGAAPTAASTAPPDAPPAASPGLPPASTLPPAPATASSSTPAWTPDSSILIDAHQDIAWNWLSFNRDPLLPVAEARVQEAGSGVESGLGQRTTSIPDNIAGHLALVFGTIFVLPGRSAPAGAGSQVYDTPEEAYTHGMEQLAAYRSLPGLSPRVRLIETAGVLDAVLASWAPEAPAENRLMGLLISMEGADPIRSPDELDEWVAGGLRAIGPAWRATRYAGGTGEPGGLTTLGRDLIAAMGAHRLLLDLSHMAEEAFYQAMVDYPGPVIASHSNPRAFLPTDRGLSDDMIRALAARDGVIGIACFNTFLEPGWQVGDPRVPLDRAVDAIEYILDLTGSAAHVAIGSDLDGGFGLSATPAGIDTSADLPKIGELLLARGHGEETVAAILNGNWLRKIRESLGG